jgi:hypothetical protein
VYDHHQKIMSYNMINKKKMDIICCHPRTYCHFLDHITWRNLPVMIIHS